MYSRAIRFAALALLSATAAGEDSNTCASTETPPVLRYFDIRGRAEPIRLALIDYGVAFEDASFSFDEWGKDKDDGFKATWTASGKIAFGQVPAMEVDGLKLVQTMAIFRYIGRKYGWYTGDAALLARIDMVAEGVLDLKGKLTAIKLDATLSADDKKAKLDAWFTGAKEAPLWFGFMENLVKGSATFFAAGTTKPTHADYLLFDAMDAHEATDAEKFAAVMKDLPALAAWRAMMMERPNLKKYLAGPTRRKP